MLVSNEGNNSNVLEIPKKTTDLLHVRWEVGRSQGGDYRPGYLPITPGKLSPDTLGRPGPLTNSQRGIYRENQRTHGDFSGGGYVGMLGEDGGGGRIPEQEEPR